MNKWVGNIQGIRKWSVMLVIILVGSLFRIYNLLNGDQLVSLLNATAVAFMGSNAVEYVKEMVSSSDNKD